MKERLSNNGKETKIKLSKELQLRMLNFFAKTSIPRMLQSANKGEK